MLDDTGPGERPGAPEAARDGSGRGPSLPVRGPIASPRQHSALEDLLALLIGSLLIGLGLLVLDELNIAMRYDYLAEAEVLAGLATRPPALHVVVTGRNARPALVAAADLVTEMGAVKHHFAAGVKAQEGIEF